jgi:hypothetical protein
VVCTIAIARQRVTKHIPAEAKEMTNGRSIDRQRRGEQVFQQYTLRFPLGSCKVVIRKSSSEDGGVEVRNENLRSTKEYNIVSLRKEDFMCVVVKVRIL